MRKGNLARLVCSGAAAVAAAACVEQLYGLSRSWPLPALCGCMDRLPVLRPRDVCGRRSARADVGLA